MPLPHVAAGAIETIEVTDRGDLDLGETGLHFPIAGDQGSEEVRGSGQASAVTKTQLPLASFSNCSSRAGMSYEL